MVLFLGMPREIQYLARKKTWLFDGTQKDLRVVFHIIIQCCGPGFRCACNQEIRQKRYLFKFIHLLFAQVCMIASFAFYETKMSRKNFTLACRSDKKSCCTNEANVRSASCVSGSGLLVRRTTMSLSILCRMPCCEDRGWNNPSGRAPLFCLQGKTALSSAS